MPPAFAAWLRDRGHVVDHVAEIGLLSATDNEIWAAAVARDATLVTKDRDFVEWAVTRAPAPQVLWLRFGNAGNLSLIARVDAAWEQIQESLTAGARVVEVGRPNSVGPQAAR